MRLGSPLGVLQEPLQLLEIVVGAQVQTLVVSLDVGEAIKT